MSKKNKSNANVIYNNSNSNNSPRQILCCSAVPCRSDCCLKFVDCGNQSRYMYNYRFESHLHEDDLHKTFWTTESAPLRNLGGKRGTAVNFKNISQFNTSRRKPTSTDSEFPAQNVDSSSNKSCNQLQKSKIKGSTNNLSGGKKGTMPGTTKMEQMLCRG